MSYVILGTCVNDGACIDACPVNAIHPTAGENGFLGADQLYIDPARCVDCNACAEICPVQAIVRDTQLPPGQERYREINAQFYELQRQASPHP